MIGTWLSLGGAVADFFKDFMFLDVGEGSARSYFGHSVTMMELSSETDTILVPVAL